MKRIIRVIFTNFCPRPSFFTCYTYYECYMVIVHFRMINLTNNIFNGLCNFMLLLSRKHLITFSYFSKSSRS